VDAKLGDWSSGMILA